MFWPWIDLTPYKNAYKHYLFFFRFITSPVSYNYPILPVYNISMSKLLVEGFFKEMNIFTGWEMNTQVLNIALETQKNGDMTSVYTSHIR